MNKVIIIGAGPAGLFAADILLKNGFAVDLYDQQSGVGKKFLIAGNGGLNLTHSEDLDIFFKRYTKQAKRFEDLITDFTPTDLRDWCKELGVDTFIGSSKRVFPENLKAAQILLSWSARLKENPNFKLLLKKKLVAISLSESSYELSFETNDQSIIKCSSDKLIFALGGGSWKKTGSDGLWANLFKENKIKLAPFTPMNCGFESQWSEIFISKINRSPLKNIVINFDGYTKRGELMITPYGIEGGAIYALSNFIRDEIYSKGKAKIILDLKPDLSITEIKKRIKKKRSKDSLTNFLRKSISLDEASLNVALEFINSNKQLSEEEKIIKGVKEVSIELLRPRDIDEAISTGGGVCFSQLSENLELIKYPGVFVIGEMLDFEAPTGGYLLQGAFSTAFRASRTIINKEEE